MNGSGSLDGADRDEEFLDPRSLALLDNWCDAVRDALDGDEVAYPGARDRVPAWMVLLAACSLMRRTEAAYLQAGALDQIVRVLPRLETLAADEERWPRELRAWHLALDAQAVEALGERLRPGPIRTAPGPDPAAERLLAIADRIDLLVLASCELAIRDAARHPDREDLSPDAAALLDAAVTTALRLAWNSPELSSLHEWYLAHGEMLSPTARALARPMRPGREKTWAAVPDRRALGLAASPITSAITCLDAAREEEGFALRIAVESIRDIAEIPTDSLASIAESQAAADVLRSFRALPEMPSIRPWAGSSRGVGGTVIQTAMRMVLPRLAAAASTEIEPPSPVFRWSPPGQEGFATWLASPSASDGRIVLRFFDASGSLSGRWAGRTVRWLGATARVEESRAIFDALELAREHTLEGIVEGADELTVDDERWSVEPPDAITE